MYNDNSKRDLHNEGASHIQFLLEEKLKILNMIDQEVLTLYNEGEIEKEIEDSESRVARIMGVNIAIAEATNSVETKTAKPK